MPIYLLDSSGKLVGWGGTSVVDTTPPAAPTGVGGTAGDGQVTVTWNANTESDLASYRVRRVSTGAVVATVTPPTHQATITGLTNGTTYHYTVEAVDTSGNTSAVSATVDLTPTAPVSSSTIFGYNTTEPDAPLSGRLSHWNNRAPMVRRYNGNAFISSNTFNITTSVAPEKRVAFSCKADGSGSFTAAGLAAGNGNARLKAWCESIPSGWTVYFCYWHEPNDDIRNGVLSISNYRGAYTKFRQAIDSATLQPGVTVKLVCNFMAYRVADTPNYFDDSWVPPEADIMTWDIYGNPGSFTGTVLTPHCPQATGAEYGASFPDVPTRFRDMFAAIVRNGFANSWGIFELNTPPRDWDGPANPDYACGSDKRLRYEGGRTASGHDSSHTEVERAAWMTAASNYCINPPVVNGVQIAPAKVVLYWENPNGANWNQAFLHDNVWNACKPFVTGSP